ncbi:LEAF RUST 10 DISEASE-RESISTANCE LOCUS RECEPTOR-LIKE PROTEIN KINASE-like 1.3 [Mercurialis annua]|uniref:LEAF RUST 10 DISEASE-RESISTANCE LOCUS RECEPTOR-LIKE PROTEIN KINASE-like 1.3 n=1 Tax=Mercurialis annua TaxID=3986 RepID=UPI00215FE965|nr:LEAF RUST 10 DISEASE-RESISTANCE LOCUS RECEPTOR-LIKE PROTEIN KINASE-like 1.3 [Mercurialis annua]
MKPHIFCLIALFFLSVLFSVSNCQDDENYRKCITPFSYGNLMHLSYPFWSDDRPEIYGHEGFKLTNCTEAQVPIITIQNEEFRVVSVNQSGSLMTIAREDYWEDICPDNFANTTLNQTLFTFSQPFPNISLFYNCNYQPPSMKQIIFPCYSRNSFYATDDILRGWGIDRPECEQRVNIPILMDDLREIWSGVEALEDVLRRGFNVVYEYHEKCQECQVTIQNQFSQIKPNITVSKAIGFTLVLKIKVF